MKPFGAVACQAEQQSLGGPATPQLAHGVHSAFQDHLLGPEHTAGGRSLGNQSMVAAVVAVADSNHPEMAKELSVYSNTDYVFPDYLLTGQLYM